jgi:hypothetical protein
MIWEMMELGITSEGGGKPIVQLVHQTPKQFCY